MAPQWTTDVTRHGPDGIAAFAAAARPLLDADPVRHTLMLTTLDKLCRPEPPPGPAPEIAAMVTVRVRDRTVGALLRPAGRAALVSAVPAEHAVTVDRVLAEADPALPGAVGPAPQVEAFAAVHTARTGASVRVDMRTRLFALERLTAPVGVVGTARAATEADRDLLDGWIDEFRAEAIPTSHGLSTRREPAAPPGPAGEARLIWEVDGEPVALAVARPPVAGMSRIGPVYTPVRHRERGYGAGVTAAATRHAIAAGARQVVLFTDLSNATTNRLYPRLGFRPSHDGLEVSFVPATACSGAP